MQLISRGMYEATYRPQKDVVIDPIEERLFTPSCYYFRLGGTADNDDIVPMTEVVTLRASERKRVFTLETFTLSARGFALIGPCTDLLGKGLWLHISPTIDPGFSGSLEMLITNLTNQPVDLEPAMVIGKAVFFYVGDTDMRLHEFVRQEKQKAAWIVRQLAGKKIKETALWVEKSIEAEAPKEFPLSE